MKELRKTKINLLNIAEPIVKWYQNEEKNLPWKQDKEPYHIWISEIMLQQTRIEAVKKYYERFMKELPTVTDLAKVEEEKLLKLWEGLGYYSRARNLKKAAEIIIKEYNGIVPREYEKLIKLPGIGEYTAGAIASICNNEKVTAVDGNVLRVISRVTGSKENVLLPKTKKKITEIIQEILPRESGDFNEGIMEVGEKICVPNGIPLCEKCPISQFCYAKENKLVTEIPVRVKDTKRKIENKTVFVIITKNKKIAIRKRDNKGLLAGLYELPNVDGMLEEKDVKKIIKDWNLKLVEINQGMNKKHIFTHIEWHMKHYQIVVEEENTEFTWISQDQLNKEYPLPTAFTKFLK